MKTVVLFMPQQKELRDVGVSLNEWMKIPESSFPILLKFAEVYIPAKKERKKENTFPPVRYLWVDFVSSAIQVEPLM